MTRSDVNILWIFGLLTLICLASGSAWAWRASGRPVWERVLISLLPCGWMTITMAIWSSISMATLVPWNNLRLAPTQAFWMGYPLYSPLGHGPILGTIYGPLSYLVYLPSVFFSTPATAIMAAVAISVVLDFVPTCCILFMAAGRRGLSPVWGASLSLIFASLYFSQLSISRTGVYVHVDHAANASFLTAFAIIYFAPSHPSVRWLIPAAFFTSLAVAGKQTFVFGLIGMPFMVWGLLGVRTALRYIVCQLLTGLGLVSLIVMTFGFRELWLNLVQVPGSHPVNLPGVLRMTTDIFSVSAGTYVLMTLAVATQLIYLWGRSEHGQSEGNGATRRSISDFIQRHRWIVLFIPILLDAPIACAGSYSFGAAWNHMAPITYMVTLAALLFLIDQIAERLQTSPSDFRSSLAFVLIALFVIAPSTFVLTSRWRDVPNAWHLYSHNPEDDAFEFALRYKGKVFFPFNPLTTLKSEGVAYHGGDSIFDRVFSNIPVSAEEFQRGLPPHMILIADPYPNTLFMRKIAANALPQFRYRLTLPELPGWTVYATTPDPDMNDVPGNASSPH